MHMPVINTPRYAQAEPRSARSTRASRLANGNSENACTTASASRPLDDFGSDDTLLGIKVGGRLVDQVDVGAEAQGNDEGDALELTAGQVWHLPSHHGRCPPRREHGKQAPRAQRVVRRWEIGEFRTRGSRRPQSRVWPQGSGALKRP